MNNNLTNIEKQDDEEKPIKEKNIEKTGMVDSNLEGWRFKAQLFFKEKAHNLLFYCILIIVVIGIGDFIWNGKSLTSDILEIFKNLVFTLCGYLFAKKDEN